MGVLGSGVLRHWENWDGGGLEELGCRYPGTLGELGAVAGRYRRVLGALGRGYPWALGAPRMVHWEHWEGGYWENWDEGTPGYWDHWENWVWGYWEHWDWGYWGALGGGYPRVLGALGEGNCGNWEGGTPGYWDSGSTGRGLLGSLG